MLIEGKTQIFRYNGTIPESVDHSKRLLCAGDLEDSCFAAQSPEDSGGSRGIAQQFHAVEHILFPPGCQKKIIAGK